MRKIFAYLRKLKDNKMRNKVLNWSGMKWIREYLTSHSLNLVIKASLEEIPEEIKEFINNINNYFKSPQRKERLKGIQIKRQLPILLPKRC